MASIVNSKLKLAQEGDINAFQELFSEFHSQLKSFLFRLLTDRNDAEDFAHDTFIRAFDKISSFRGQSSLKSWVFQIAANMAKDELRKRSRWSANTTAKAKEIVMNDLELATRISRQRQDPNGRFEMREHIDTCFTCVGKSLPIAEQVVLILKEVYSFTVLEITQILSLTEGAVKYSLTKARGSMNKNFEQNCSLVNKNGVCYQCSELNSWLNEKPFNKELHLSDVSPDSQQSNDDLFELRLALIREIDPLKTTGHKMQEILMKCNRLAEGRS